jgi:hypothetical protein
VDSNYAKFRCDKARVVDIVNFYNGITLDRDTSFHRPNFVYRKGDIVSTYYDPQINEVCSSRIHYFKTQDAAISWWYRQKDKHPKNGVLTWWYDSGEKYRKLVYKERQLNGVRTFWYETGQKESECIFKDGKPDGVWTNWYKNGQKEDEGMYKMGRRDGVWNWFSPDGDIYRVRTYN